VRRPHLTGDHAGRKVDCVLYELPESVG